MIFLSVLFFALFSFCGVSFAAGPTTFNVGHVTVTVHGAATIGTGIRVGKQEADILNEGSARSVGVNGTATGGNNSDDGDLNYARGDIYSTALKGMISVNARYKNIGLFCRARAWTDFTLNYASVPFGNISDGYKSNSPLSDAGYDHRAKFTGVDYGDTYAYGSWKHLAAKLGLINVRWGTPSMIRNGLSNINPIDYNALHRPGALPQEVLIPFPGVDLKSKLNSAVTVEGFYEFSPEFNDQVPCGEFFAIPDYNGQAPCDKVLVGGPSTLTDAQRIADGLYWNRDPDVNPNNQGEFGVKFNIKSPALRTNFGLMYANYDSRTANLAVRTSSRAGNIQFIPGNPDGKNGTYFMTYVKNLQVVGANFTTCLNDALNIAGQVVYTANLPLEYNLGDVLVANAAPIGSPGVFLAKQLAAVPKGGVWEPWQSFGQIETSLSANKTFKGVAGAQSLTLGVEFGLKAIPGLPSPDVMRFGRPDVYGIGPVPGVPCSPGSKGCTDNGFVTDISYGYRLRASMKYKEVLPHLDLIPSVVYGQDISGYSADNQFIEGRQFAQLALTAVYKRMYYMRLVYVPIWGGDFNIAEDHSYGTLTLGMRF